MSSDMTEQAEKWYRPAERKAAEYYSMLEKEVREKSYIPFLTNDIRIWKNNHIKPYSWLSSLTRRTKKPSTREYKAYIQWLNYTNKLDGYLVRSVSYMYMRDLGKTLESPDTQARIRRLAASMKDKLLRGSAEGMEREDAFGFEGLYRWSQKEGVESAAIWVMNKLSLVSANIPQDMNAEHAVRKLIKIIFGVIMHVTDDMDDRTPPEERSRRLDEAIRLGYCYGLTYPFIDDLLDSKALSEEEKERYSGMLREALVSGRVPDPEDRFGTNAAFMAFVHSELRDAFEYIRNYQRPETLNVFYEQSYVFFESQHKDRVKELSNPAYTNEELYVPIIIKSASSRLIVRSVISASADDGFDHRTFHYGIYNQLADDFADMFDDMADGAVTPYTYYLKYRERRPDLINPFELYWAVISHLIHHVFGSDAEAREVILDRVINGLKRCKERLGSGKYNELMDIFASGNPEFNRVVQHMVRKAEDVDFFDKLLRDRMVASLRSSREEKSAFFDTIASVREQINRELLLPKNEEMLPMKEKIVDAANYSLEGGGKRLRPILAWVMGVQEYGLPSEAMVPLLRSLEYMHTASLIFDDLPTQDNASTRRGRPTLHQVHDSATAELSGLFLILKAVEQQASLAKFDASTVLALMKYSSQRTADMCIGQAMDLEARGKTLTLEQLNEICFHKTGIAFEASLVMPAILARADETDIAALKSFAYHAGIAFQIKDDLLDAEGDSASLGKPAGQDVANNNSTFVTVLGQEGAAKEMWDHYCCAMEQLAKMPRNTAFLKHLMNYIINRGN